MREWDSASGKSRSEGVDRLWCVDQQVELSPGIALRFAADTGRNITLLECRHFAG
jgi:hypothetical protein